jgi:hypothetical protein
MLINIGKTGKFAVGLLSVALSATLVTPANATIPAEAPAGTQEFFSNGKATMIFGSGSDTTFPLHQDLATIFNRAPGCLTQALPSNQGGIQLFDMACNPEINNKPGKAPGFANYDRDLAAEYYFIGSSGGRDHVARWNQGTQGTVQADYFRSSSSGVRATDQRSIAYAADALGAFVFDQVKIGADAPFATPASNVTELRKQQVSDIYKGNTKCWATIDLTLSGLADVADGSNADYVTGGKFDEVKWIAEADAAKGAGYKESDAYKACTPIAVYTVPDTSGTRQAWDSLAALGTGAGEEFLTKVNPLTGDFFTTDEKGLRSIPENNATWIVDRLEEDGVNTDVVTNAMYFYSVGKYTTALGGLDDDGNPQLSGNSTKTTGFLDRLLSARADAPVSGVDAPAVIATASTIAGRQYIYARQLFFGYQYPNQATRNYMDPIHGFLCSTKTAGMKDPINSFDVRGQIEGAMLDAGFFPLPVGNAGVPGSTEQSYCRQAALTSNTGAIPGSDVVAPTVGFGVDSTNKKKPVFTLTFNELVSGVSSSTIGIKEVNNAGALIGNAVAATIECKNARQAVIPCLAKTSDENYDLSPLEFVKTATIRPNADLVAGKKYKAFAVGTTDSAVEIQDRAGLAGWPIVDGNGLVNAESAEVAIKDPQTAPTVAANVAVNASITFSKNTAQGLPMTASSTTTGVCTVATVGNNIRVTGKAVGTCTVTLTQAGNDSYTALPSTVKTITVGKGAQAAPAIANSVKAKGEITFSKFTSGGNQLMVATATPASTCKLTTSGNNFVVTGVKAGNCTVTLTQAGNANFLPLARTVKVVKVVN